MNNSNQTTNPYNMQKGYINPKAMAITGYGIGIESIQHWLFDHDFATNPANVTMDNSAHAIDNYLSAHIHNCAVTYVATPNNNFTGLMANQMDYSATTKLMPSIYEINDKLIQAIELLYAIPASYYDDLVDFMESCAGYINICTVVPINNHANVA